MQRVQRNTSIHDTNNYFTDIQVHLSFKTWQWSDAAKYHALSKHTPKRQTILTKGFLRRITHIQKPIFIFFMCVHFRYGEWDANHASLINQKEECLARAELKSSPKLDRVHSEIMRGMWQEEIYTLLFWQVRSSGRDQVQEILFYPRWASSSPQDTSQWWPKLSHIHLNYLVFIENKCTQPT